MRKIDITKWYGHDVDYCLAALIGQDRDQLADMLVDGGFILDSDLVETAADLLLYYRARIPTGALRQELVGNVTLPTVATAVAYDVIMQDTANLQLDQAGAGELFHALMLWSRAVTDCCALIAEHGPDEVAALGDHRVQAVCQFMTGIDADNELLEDTRDLVFHARNVLPANLAGQCRNKGELLYTAARYYSGSGQQGTAFVPQLGNGRVNAEATAKLAKLALMDLLAKHEADLGSGYVSAVFGALDNDELGEQPSVHLNHVAAFNLMSVEQQQQYREQFVAVQRLIQDSTRNSPIALLPGKSFFDYYRTAMRSRLLH